MKDTRANLTQYYQGPMTEEDTLHAISQLRSLVDVMQVEGLIGMELSLCLTEQAQLFAHLGDEDSKRLKLRHALQARLLCLGVDHPSSRALAAQIHE